MGEKRHVPVFANSNICVSNARPNCKHIVKVSNLKINKQRRYTEIYFRENRGI